MARTKKTFQSSFADVKADYEMSRTSRFIRKRSGVTSRGSGSNYHFRNETDYYSSLEQARDMDRNDALTGILADRRVDNIVQGGFKLDPKTGDKGLDLELYNRWQDFASDADQCDIAGESNWAEIERTSCRAECVDGDIVIAGTKDGAFQIVESHLIQTRTQLPDTFLGVTTDQYGKRLQYHVIEEKDQFGTLGDSEPWDVRDKDGTRQIFHVYNPKRVNQTRGVTALAPVFMYAGILEDINFAKLVQQQIVSCFAIFRENPSKPNLPSSSGYGETSMETTATGQTRTIDGISPGMDIDGSPGQKLHGFSPNVPNSEYFQQVRLILQIIGVNFGLPLCLVLMDGSETNFSGWRGAVDEARKGFVTDQQNLVRRLHRPAYIWRTKNLLNTDPSLREWSQRPGIKIFNHNWNPPTWTYIEPVADAEGDAMQISNSLTSPRRLHAARGNDWEEISEEIIDDNMYAIERAAKKADEFNKLNPTSQPLNWRDVISLPMQKGKTINLQDPLLVDSKNSDSQKKPEVLDA